MNQFNLERINVITNQNYREQFDDKFPSFNKEKDLKIKDKLYQKDIKPILHQWILALIHVYGYSSLNLTDNELFSDCEKYIRKNCFHRYNENIYGSAFSYFSVCIRSRLCYKTKMDQRLIKRIKTSKLKWKYNRLNNVID